MSVVTRTAGVAGTFTAVFSEVPVGTPTVTIFTDLARTVVAVATTGMTATANPASWTAAYPASLAAGTYYLTFSAVYTVGQPAKLDQDDTLILTAPGVNVGAALVTLAEAKAYMGVTANTHDAEITRLCNASLGAVELVAGPALVRRQFVETYIASGSGQLLLNRYPIVSLFSVASVVAGVVTVSPSPATIADPDLGRIDSPFSYGTVRVTYTAGLSPTPDEAVDAALIYVSYKYRRNHGGSESYMPAGVDGGIAPPMGTRALGEQMRLALGQFAGGMRVA